MNNKKYSFPLTEKQFLVALFIFSLILKLAYGYIFEDRFHPAKFNFSPHETMATNLVQGKGLIYEMKINETLTIKRYYEDELIYPLICAFVYWITKHNIIVMLIIQSFYVSLIPIFIYLISKLLFNINVARLAAILATFVPGIIVYASSKIHSMTFYSLIFCISLWAALRFIKKQDTGNWIFLGFMLGVGILSRNSFIFFVPALLLYLYLAKTANIYKIFKIAIIAFIVLIPVIMRNYFVYNKFVVLKPVVSWPAINPKAAGTLYHSDGTHSFSDVNKELFSEYKNLTDLEYADIINKEVISNIKKDKLRYAKLSLRRFYYFWWFSPASGREYPEYYLFFYKPYYSFILLFSIIGLIILATQHRKKGSLQNYHWLLVPIFIISTTLPHYLYYSEGRHRFALEPLLLIFTSYGILCSYNYLIRPIFHTLKSRSI